MSPQNPPPDDLLNNGSAIGEVKLQNKRHSLAISPNSLASKQHKKLSRSRAFIIDGILGKVQLVQGGLSVQNII